MKYVVWIFLALSPRLLTAQPSSREILIPNVVAFARGANGAFWGTEIRLINPTTGPRTCRVVDWIGSGRQVPFDATVAAGTTRVVGGWELYSAWLDNMPFISPTGEAEFGAAICEIDDGLLVVARTLSSTLPDVLPPFRPSTCAGNTGGYVYAGSYDLKMCNWGVGPMLYAERSFFEPGQPQNLLMLNPRRNHYRTNLVIVNGDAAEATVTIDAVGGAGEKATKVLRVPARTYFQLNDIYSLPEFADLEAASEDIRSFGQRATVTCSTRCYAIAYVISNENNTASIVEPR